MTEIKQVYGTLHEQIQQIVAAGLEEHTRSCDGPPYKKDLINWLVYEDDDSLVGVLTAESLWDWVYIGELWVDEKCRGKGIGRQLMGLVEEHAVSKKMIGIWLWTQSWQAPRFYEQMGFKEFARFEEFPEGHYRIGYRKRVFS